jgi:hypothetical protein
MPVEWTGRQRQSAAAPLHALPATQGQSLRYLSQPLFAEPHPLRQLTSESSQPQPFLAPGVERVTLSRRLVPCPLRSSPDSAVHQNGVPEPHP